MTLEDFDKATARILTDPEYVRDSIERHQKLTGRAPHPGMTKLVEAMIEDLKEMEGEV